MEEFGFTADELDWVHQRMAHHSGNSAQSIDEYVRAQCIRLAATVMRRRRVYLDTCYWIRLRDADLGRKVAAGDQQLLAALRSHVREGRLLCPINDATIYEVHKQSDDSTRGATAELIDELSTGVAIRTQRDRMATELARMLHRRAGLDTLDSSLPAWVPVSTVLGEQHPVTAAFPDDVQLALQKGVYDLMSRIRLSDMTRLTGKVPRDEQHSDRVARDLHAANQQHAGEHATFDARRSVGSTSRVSSQRHNGLQSCQRRSTILRWILHRVLTPRADSSTAHEAVRAFSMRCDFRRDQGDGMA
jgi:hypothetical protein